MTTSQALNSDVVPWVEKSSPRNVAASLNTSGVSTKPYCIPPVVYQCGSWSTHILSHQLQTVDSTVVSSPLRPSDTL